MKKRKCCLFIFGLIQKRTKKIKTNEKSLRKYYGTFHHRSKELFRFAKSNSFWSFIPTASSIFKVFLIGHYSCLDYFLSNFPASEMLIFQTVWSPYDGLSFWNIMERVDENIKKELELDFLLLFHHGKSKGGKENQEIKILNRME